MGNYGPNPVRCSDQFNGGGSQLRGTTAHQLKSEFEFPKYWSGRWYSNSWPQPWQGGRRGGWKFKL